MQHKTFWPESEMPWLLFCSAAVCSSSTEEAYNIVLATLVAPLHGFSHGWQLPWQTRLMHDCSFWQIASLNHSAKHAKPWAHMISRLLY